MDDGQSSRGTLPLYEELGECRRKRAPVLQLDVHLDVYNLTDCLKEPSHGNFLMHADGPLPPIVNLGHREFVRALIISPNISLPTLPPPSWRLTAPACSRNCGRFSTRRRAASSSIWTATSSTRRSSPP